MCINLNGPETFIWTSLSLALLIEYFSYCRALLPTFSSLDEVHGNTVNITITKVDTVVLTANQKVLVSQDPGDTQCVPSGGKKT